MPVIDRAPPADSWQYEPTGFIAPTFESTQTSEPRKVRQTRTLDGFGRASSSAASLHRGTRAFMDALGGETRPNAEAEAAFAAARQRRVRHANVVGRRSGPPRAR